MVRTIRWWAFFWGYLIYIAPKLKIADKMQFGSEEHEKFIQGLAINWVSKLLEISGVRVEIDGKENITDEKAVYVANHQGNFDVPIMLALVGKPRTMIGKSELLKIPIINKFIYHLRGICVDRNDPKDGLKAVITAINYIKEGKSMTIFPEGTRSKCSEMGEFKAGSSTIAKRAGAVIIPVTIDGTYKIMEINKWKKITPADVKITIHPAIDPVKMSKEEFKQIDAKIMNIISSKL